MFTVTPIKVVQDVYATVLKLLYPPRCVVCQSLLETTVLEPRAPTKSDDFFCPDCAAQIDPIPPPICQKCGGRIENGAHGFCGDCVSRFGQLRFGRNTAFIFYDDIAKALIHGFKYSGYQLYGEALVALMAEKTGFPFAATADILVPVPLHPTRLAERGFNQAEVLARHIAAKTGLSVVADGLKRTRATVRQSLLGHNARGANIAGAFAADRIEAVWGKRVLLVDDIYTTGGTLSECAAALLAAGASSVDSFTVCKTKRSTLDGQ